MKPTLSFSTLYSPLSPPYWGLSALEAPHAGEVRKERSMKTPSDSFLDHMRIAGQVAACRAWNSNRGLNAEDLFIAAVGEGLVPPFLTEEHPWWIPAYEAFKRGCYHL